MGAQRKAHTPKPNLKICRTLQFNQKPLFDSDIAGLNTSDM